MIGNVVSSGRVRVEGWSVAHAFSDAPVDQLEQAIFRLVPLSVDRACHPQRLLAFVASFGARDPLRGPLLQDLIVLPPRFLLLDRQRIDADRAGGGARRRDGTGARRRDRRRVRGCLAALLLRGRSRCGAGRRGWCGSDASATRRGDRRLVGRELAALGRFRCLSVCARRRLAALCLVDFGAVVRGGELGGRPIDTVEAVRLGAEVAVGEAALTGCEPPPTALGARATALAGCGVRIVEGVMAPTVGARVNWCGWRRRRSAQRTSPRDGRKNTRTIRVYLGNRNAWLSGRDPSTT